MSLTDLNNCGHCAYRGRSRAGELECWREPPRAVALPMTGGPALIGAGPTAVSWLVKAVRPPVRAEETCGEFAVAPEVAN